MKQNMKKVQGMSKMQCAGKKNRSPLDHIITLFALAQQSREHNAKTYLFFADAVQCLYRL